MILLDANILMYAGGAAHAHKADCLALLAVIAEGRVDAAMDVEVLQEILHRYRAIGRSDLGFKIYEMARTIVPEFIPICLADVDVARDLMRADPGLTARDGLHAAVCLRVGCEAFCTYDRDFERVPALRRTEPAGVLAEAGKRGRRD